MFRVFAFFAVAVLVVQIAASQREALGLIEGVVVRLGTVEPLSDVDVELARLEGTAAYPLGPLTYPPGDMSPGAFVRPTYPNPSDLRHVRTKTDGRFSFANLPPGTYRLLAARAGGAYYSAEYGQHHPRGRGYNFQFTAGQTMRDVKLEMALTGSISGKVLDPDGAPAARVQVMVFEASYQSGRKLLGLLQSALTDDRGEYRLFYLPPGRYFIGARAEDPRKRNISFRRYGQEAGRETFSEAPVTFRTIDTGEVLEETYAIVYYGGDTDPVSARPITVASGASVNGIDILLNMGQPRALHVRGVVVDAAGQPAARATVRVIPRVWNPSLMAPGASTAADGTFEITGVPPGMYSIRASRTDRSPATPATPANAVTTSAIAPLEVGNGNVEGIRLVLNAGATASGRIILEGRTTSGEPPDISALRVYLVPDNPMFPQATATPPSGNSFTVTGIQPGDYRLSLSPVLPINTGPPYSQPTAVPAPFQNTYVKSIRMGGEDVLERGVHLQGEPPREMEIILGVNGGILQGIVVDRQQQPMPNAVVALIPAPTLRARTDLYKSTTSGADGRFRIAGLAPGDYRVFAWEYVEEGIWYDAEFIRSVETRGKSIRISEGGAESIELPVLVESR